MAKDLNPFLLQGYEGAAYFCDRKKELAFLKSALANQRNVSIISLRRLGKTSLIKHLFKTQCSFTPVFIDIYRCTDQKQMIIRLVEECINQVGRPGATLLKKAASFFRSLELSMSIDPISSLPEVSVGLRPGKEETVALAELFKYLENQDKQVVIAIDEFQQIIDFPEKNTEALLREHVQNLRNVNFIFSGSNKRMLQAIFSHSKRPFYQATEPLYLEKIPSDIYSDFIEQHFKNARRKMSLELIYEGLTWCREHTYHVQYLFNRLYSLGIPNYKQEHMTLTQESILKERGPEYMTLMRLLSTHQAALLRAIAKADKVKAPFASEFLNQHRLSAVSTVRQSLGVLLDKELVHQEDGAYLVSDVFLSRWAAQSS